MIIRSMLDYILLSIFLLRSIHVFSGFLFFSSFCPSVSFSFSLSFLSSFLISLVISLHPHQSRQCSNKYLFTFFNFCKIKPPKMVKGICIFIFNRYFHITVQISLQPFILLSAVNESIYVFTSLPEPVIICLHFCQFDG